MTQALFAHLPWAPREEQDEIVELLPTSDTSQESASIAAKSPSVNQTTSKNKLAPSIESVLMIYRTRKHMLKHEKTYYCDVKVCKRHKQGFGTVNDLNRHRKSVHKLSSHGGGVTKSYRCSARGCEKSDKVWPRFDNFKQHVFRVHKEEHQGDEKVVATIVERYVAQLEFLRVRISAC